MCYVSFQIDQYLKDQEDCPFYDKAWSELEAEIGDGDWFNEVVEEIADAEHPVSIDQVKNRIIQEHIQERVMSMKEAALEDRYGF
ncbi:hypothetical protein A3715_26885 [Oleiphilus sp. HI0009]|nr:hypothetical protein A3715_18160 [Oleiphilus sp. HI0009]KZX86371.1 hypothetical protein A3715_26885 [Oleiphilus sp. HI0009]